MPVKRSQQKIAGAAEVVLGHRSATFCEPQYRRAEVSRELLWAGAPMGGRNRGQTRAAPGFHWAWFLEEKSGDGGACWDSPVSAGRIGAALGIWERLDYK